MIPLFAEIHHEPEATVRTSVGRMLLDFITHCDTKRSLELLDIIEKLFNRSFEKFTEEGKIILKNDNEMIHITTMADELIRVCTLSIHCFLLSSASQNNDVICFAGVCMEIVSSASIACHQNIPNTDWPFGEILHEDCIDGPVGGDAPKDFRMDVENARQRHIQYRLSGRKGCRREQ